MLLCDAFCNPHDVATFLLFQLQVGVENSKVELLHESIDVQFDLKRKGYLKLIEIVINNQSNLMFEELIFQSFIAGVVSRAIEQSRVFSVVFSDSFYLFVVICTSQCRKAIREHLTTSWI